VKAFFDTSVLIPVFYGDHPHHEASLTAFVEATKEEACCGAHSLVEVYATLTRMPGRYRMTSEQAMLFVDNVQERLSVIALGASDYARMLQHYASLGIVGGAIYDAVLARCALKSGAEVILTWNTRHYRQFGSEVTRRLRLPSNH
jgi:predicted nucleic acid-binding protein